MKNNLSELKNKEILVTGGCGFIGSEVTKQLSDLGAIVTVLDNLSSGKEEYIKNLSNVTLFKGDQTNGSDVKKAVKDKEFVINLTALPFIPDSYYYPREFFDVNVDSTIKLILSLIKEKKVKKFVHISSSEVYGSAHYSPMDENHPTIPQSTYAVSKLAGERLVFTMHKEHNFPAVIIRPFNSFGPNITQPYIIPEIIQQILEGKDAIKLGNINSKRDFTFVTDTARAIISTLVADSVVGETINVGLGKSIAIKELVTIVSEILGKDVSIEVDSSRFRPYDVESLICDNGLASKLLGWQPKTSLREGLEITIEWIKNYGVSLKSPFKNWPSVYRDEVN